MNLNALVLCVGACALSAVRRVTLSSFLQNLLLSFILRKCYLLLTWLSNVNCWLTLNFVTVSCRTMTCAVSTCSTTSWWRRYWSSTISTYATTRAAAASSTSCLASAVRCQVQQILGGHYEIAALLISILCGSASLHNKMYDTLLVLLVKRGWIIRNRIEKYHYHGTMRIVDHLV